MDLVKIGHQAYFGHDLRVSTRSFGKALRIGYADWVNFIHVLRHPPAHSVKPFLPV